MVQRTSAIDEFLAMLAAERGAAGNTISAYRRVRIGEQCVVAGSSDDNSSASAGNDKMTINFAFFPFFSTFLVFSSSSDEIVSSTDCFFVPISP